MDPGSGSECPGRSQLASRTCRTCQTLWPFSGLGDIMRFPDVLGAGSSGSSSLSPNMSCTHNSPQYRGNNFPDPYPSYQRSSADPLYLWTPARASRVPAQPPGSRLKGAHEDRPCRYTPRSGKGSPGPGSMSLEKSGSLNISPSSESGKPGPGNNHGEGDRLIRHVLGHRRGPLGSSITDTPQVRHIQHISRLRKGRPGSRTNVTIKARQLRDL